MEHVHEGGCPGSKMMQFKATQEESTLEQSQTYMKPVSRLGQWPCCGGLQRAAENALRNSGKFIPWQVVTISRDGRILD